VIYAKWRRGRASESGANDAKCPIRGAHSIAGHRRRRQWHGHRGPRTKPPPRPGNASLPSGAVRFFTRAETTTPKEEEEDV